MKDDLRDDDLIGAASVAAVERWRAIPDEPGRDALLRDVLRARLAALPSPEATVHQRVRRARRARGWAFASAVAAVLVVAIAIEGRRQRGTAHPFTPDLAAATVPVVFALDAGDARRVSLVGDFNGWSTGGAALTRSGNRWSVTVPLAAGRYAYTFRVDDRWVADDLAPRAPQDFGPPTSILVVSNGRP